MGRATSGLRAWAKRGRGALGRLLVVGRRRFRIDGLDIDAPPELVSLGLRRQLRAKTYEKDELEAVARHLDPSLPVIEFGGGIGLVACAINRRLRDPADHVVVEMNPRILEVLRANRDRNRASYEVRNAALWYEGSARVNVAESYCGSVVQKDVGVVVPKTTVRSILKEKGWKSINLVMDVEGAEHQMMEAEWPEIAACVGVLILEVHPFNGMAPLARSTLATLAGAGFAHHHVYGINHVFAR